MPVRFDVGLDTKIKKTPQGGFRIDSFLTRTGVFKYYDEQGGEILEYRPPDEVFNEDSLSSLDSAPVTVNHPPEFVNSDNYSAYSVGHVHGRARQDGLKIAGELVVNAKKGIQAISELGLKQVSCGYTCELEDSEGVTPEGEKYHKIQRNIKYNHVALVKAGRAGPDIGLRLDSAGDQVLENTAIIQKNEKVKDMEYITIDGRRFELGSKEHLDYLDSKQKQIQDEKTQLEKEFNTLQGRFDSQEAKIKELEIALKKEQDVQKLDSEIEKRALLIEEAKKLAPKLDAKGKSSLEIMKEALQTYDSTIKLDGKDEAYVQGRFEGLCSLAVKKDHAEERLNLLVPSEKEDEYEVEIDLNPRPYLENFKPAYSLKAN